MFSLPLPRGIDPRVDVVFTSHFGEPAHEPLRIDFLNTVLGADVPRITAARTLNAVHPASLLAERELRVDVEVTDDTDRVYQIEMQRQTRRGLHQRMLYGWARLYAGQASASAEYHALRPVVGIWICEQDAFATSEEAHLHFPVAEVDEPLPLPRASPLRRRGQAKTARAPRRGEGLGHGDGHSPMAVHALLLDDLELGVGPAVEPVEVSSSSARLSETSPLSDPYRGRLRTAGRHPCGRVTGARAPPRWIWGPVELEQGRPVPAPRGAGPRPNGRARRGP